MRKSEFFVIKVEQCDTCGGQGVIQHPDWQIYWQEYKERYPHGPKHTYEDLCNFDDEFWRSLGYYNHKQPPEEIACPDCEGRATIETKVPLEEALAALRVREAEHV